MESPHAEDKLVPLFGANDQSTLPINSVAYDRLCITSFLSIFHIICTSKVLDSYLADESDQILIAAYLHKIEIFIAESADYYNSFQHNSSPMFGLDETKFFQEAW